MWKVGMLGLTVVFSIISTLAQAQSLESQKSEVQAETRAEKTGLIVTNDYIIGPEDVLEISVWRNADLSRQVVVRPDGKISLPLIGDVMAVGRTTSELKGEIVKRLQVYKENPTIAIVVLQVKSYFYFVQGAVGGQGKFPLLTKTSLVQAITLSGGLAPDAIRSKIVIFRFGVNGKSPQKLVVNYNDIIEGDAQDIVLKPGDTIVVPSETRILLP